MSELVELLTRIPWGMGSAGAIVFAVIIAIIRGDLITGKMHQTVLEAERKRGDDAVLAVRELVPQITNLTEVSKTTNLLLQTLKDRRALAEPDPTAPGGA